MKIVKIRDDQGRETWVYTKPENAVMGGTLYFFGGPWTIIEIEEEVN